MLVWIVEIGEPLPGIDADVREWRCGMLVRALVTGGHTVTWWASTFDHISKRQRAGYPTRIQVEPALEIRLLHGPGYTKNRSIRRWIHHRVVAARFSREARDERKPDIVFCCLPTIELAFESVRYGTGMGVPVCIDIRDLWPDEYSRGVPNSLRGMFHLLLLWERRRVERALTQTAAITAISERFLEWGLTQARRRRTNADAVFPMGYPARRMYPVERVQAKTEQYRQNYGLDRNRMLVTFVGSFTHSFDFATVVRAAREFDRGRGSEIKFILAGDGPTMSEVRGMASGVTNMFFPGWLDQESVRAILDLSSVGLAPYHDSASMSLPNKPFEYMAAGLPILSSLKGELEHLITKEGIGLQYQGGDVASLFERLTWLLSNPECRIEMATKALELFKERFSDEVIYPSLVLHLEKVCRVASEDQCSKRDA